MTTVGDQLRQYATAVSDPTRGSILMELSHAGELTATQLARRLGLTPNNVYHHMRVLLQLGVVDPPRAVPGDTYVEKYYHLNPDIQGAVTLDPAWYDQAQDGMTREDRRAAVVSICLTMAHLLRQAASRYQEMDAEELDRYARAQRLVLLCIQELSRERLGYRVAGMREILERERQEFSEDTSPPTDLVLFASLPALWDEVRQGEST